MNGHEVQLIIEANRVTNAMVKEMHDEFKGVRQKLDEVQDKVDKHETVYQAGKWAAATAIAGILGWLGFK